MNERDQLIAYLATLATLALIFISALVAGALQPGIIGALGAFGLGTVTGGLLGVLKMPSARNPVAQTDSGDVTVAAPATPPPAPPQ